MEVLWFVRKPKANMLVPSLVFSIAKLRQQQNSHQLLVVQQAVFQARGCLV